MATNLSLFNRVDLSSLPEPNVVALPEFAAIKREIIALFVSLEPGYKLLLESDPVAKLIEAWSYREMIMRDRINQAAKANLLAKASGGDLDQLAAFYGVTRMTVQAADTSVYPPISAVYEDDESFRYRTQLRIMAWANAGGVDHYRYWALSANTDVSDVAVYSPIHPNGYNMGGRVVVTVLGKSGNRVPTEEVLTDVLNVVTGPAVRVVSDIISVEPAVLRPVNIVASIRLLPRTPRTIFEGLYARVRASFDAQQALGWDVTRSWLIDQLHEAGVHSVTLTSPAVDFIIPPNEFPSIDNLSLTLLGFSDREAEEIGALELARLQRMMYDTYVQYAVANQRTPGQIANDLAFVDRAGIIQPTSIGLARHLGIDRFYAADQQTLLTELEICTMIHSVIANRYGNNL